MTTTVETENRNSRVDATSGDAPTAAPLTDSLVAIQGLSGAKRMTPEEQCLFFRNTKNFFE